MVGLGIHDPLDIATEIHGAIGGIACGNDLQIRISPQGEGGQPPADQFTLSVLCPVSSQHRLATVALVRVRRFTYPSEFGPDLVDAARRSGH
jgi:hypothetical protein